MNNNTVKISIKFNLNTAKRFKINRHSIDAVIAGIKEVIEEYDFLAQSDEEDTDIMATNIKIIHENKKQFKQNKF